MHVATQLTQLIHVVPVCAECQWVHVHTFPGRPELCTQAAQETSIGVLLWHVVACCGMRVVAMLCQLLSSANIVYCSPMEAPHSHTSNTKPSAFSTCWMQEVNSGKRRRLRREGAGASRVEEEDGTDESEECAAAEAELSDEPDHARPGSDHVVSDTAADSVHGCPAQSKSGHTHVIATCLH